MKGGEGFPMTKKELNDYLLAIADGDAEAFTAVYRAYYQPVYLMAASMAREPALAEDIAQEVFITVRRCAEQYRAGGQSQAWIFGITKNIARYFVRQRWTEVPMDQENPPITDMGDILEKQEPSMEKGCLEKIIVAQALEKLNAMEYHITVLHVFAGLKLSEIATFDQIPYGTILWRYDQAKKKLRKYYATAERRERSDIGCE